MDVQQREGWSGGPAFLGKAWTMTKGGRTATCALFSHQLGWELRLAIDGGVLQRSQVCRSNDEILDTQQQWNDDRQSLV